MTLSSRLSRTGALWDVALECAYRREFGRCDSEFGADACVSCKYNIANYGVFLDSDVKLFMFKAEGEACLAYLKKRDERVGWFVFVLLIIAGIIWWNHSEDVPNKRTYGNNYRERSVSQPVQARKEPAPVKPTTLESATASTLDRVAARLRQNADVNRDGLTNCIDAAVLFYQYYPDKNKVCIELNVNKRTDMNHLFNCVLIDGNWVAIEPQAYWHNKQPVRMKNFWGDRYDRQYNRDVTNDYLKYVR